MEHMVGPLARGYSFANLRGKLKKTRVNMLAYNRAPATGASSLVHSRLRLKHTVREEGPGGSAIELVSFRRRPSQSPSSPHRWGRPSPRGDPRASIPRACG